MRTQIRKKVVKEFLLFGELANNSTVKIIASDIASAESRYISCRACPWAQLVGCSRPGWLVVEDRGCEISWGKISYFLNF